jgi:hypothetical protein
MLIYLGRCETEPFGVCAVNVALYQHRMIAEKMVHLVLEELTEGTQILEQILPQPFSFGHNSHTKWSCIEFGPYWEKSGD